MLYLQMKALNFNEFSFLRKIIRNLRNSTIKFRMKEKKEAKMTPKFCVTRMAVLIINIGSVRYIDSLAKKMMLLLGLCCL